MSEICLHDDLKGQPNPYYVVANDQLIVVRFLFIYNNSNSVSIEGSQIPHISFKKIFLSKKELKKEKEDEEKEGKKKE